MLAKLTSTNRITLPTVVLNVAGQPENFDIQTKNGQIILTPVLLQRADAVRVKLAEPGLIEEDMANAVASTRKSTH